MTDLTAWGLTGVSVTLGDGLLEPQISCDSRLIFPEQVGKESLGIQKTTV